MKEGRYRFFYYSDEGDPREPSHVHVTAGGQIAKFWLDPVELQSQSSKGLRAHEINHLRNLVERHQSYFMEAWYAHFES